MEEKVKWNDTCERFVAFLDIMGFKDMVFRNTHEKIYNILIEFKKRLDDIENTIGRTPKKPDEKSRSNSENDHPIGQVIFSDSIILVTNDDSFDSFVNLVSSIFWIFNFALPNNIPIKGAIAYGKTTADFNNSLHFGRPIIDAFELQNEFLMYGIVLHHSAEQFFANNNLIEKLDRLFFKWQAPFRSANVSHYILNYISVSIEKKKVQEAIPKLCYLVSGVQRQYVDNTIKFLDFVKEEETKLQK